MRINNDLGSNDQPGNDNTDLCSITGDLYRVNGTNLINDIYQCDNWSVESCDSK